MRRSALQLWFVILCVVPGCAQRATKRPFEFPTKPIHASYAHAGVSASAQSHNVVASATSELPQKLGEMTLQQALALSLQNSDIVRVSQGGRIAASNNTSYDIGVAESRMLAALAAYDASLMAELHTTRINQPPNAIFGPGLSQPELRDEALVNFAVTKPWLTGGTSKIAFNPDPNYLFLPRGGGSNFNPTHVGELEFSISQPILRGAGIAVNAAPIEITQIETQQSAWEFKKAVMAGIRSTFAAYWELQAAQVSLEATNRVIPYLKEIVHLQEESRKTEWVTDADVAKARAFLYDFRQERAQRQSELAAAELRLRNLLGLPPCDGWQIVAVTAPGTAPIFVDSDHSVNVAIEQHPDLVRQRLDLRIRELELLVARNGLLPKVDFRALYRMNGVGQELGPTLSQMFSGEFSDYLVGLSLELPVGRRQARANTAAAELQLARANGLLDQETISVAHQVRDRIREIEFAFKEYSEANHLVVETKKWMDGARVRYRNPRPDGGSNWLLQSLNEYLDALRFRRKATTDAAEVLARYNTALIELEEAKGTLLEFLNINLLHDPCQQSQWLAAPQYHLQSQPRPLIGENVAPDAQQPTTDRWLEYENPSMLEAIR